VIEKRNEEISGAKERSDERPSVDGFQIVSEDGVQYLYTLVAGFAPQTGGAKAPLRYGGRARVCCGATSKGHGIRWNGVA